MRCLEPIWRRGVSELIARPLLTSSVDVPERVGCKMSGLHFAKPTLLIAELPIGMNDLAWKMFSVLNIPALKTSKHFAKMQALMRHLTVLFGAPPLFALRVCMIAFAAYFWSNLTLSWVQLATSEAEAFCPINFRARRHAGAP